MCKVRTVEQGFESCTEPEFFQAYYLQLQKLQLLQSYQFKHTPLDSFAESIIWTNESDSRCRNKCQI